MKNAEYDVIILGAGGAGMMCALQAGYRGRRVLLLDHSRKLGGKILISGGGRCNFTNLGASSAQYYSKNPHFCKSALSRFPSSSFIEMVKSHGIPFHEKKLGQLFCDGSAQNIVDLLVAECNQAGAEFKLECKIERISKVDQPEGKNRFQIETSQGDFFCESLVVATGGFSIPKIGATGFGYQIARQFGLAIVETLPALDGFTMGPEYRPLMEGLAGISVDCVIQCNESKFRENILFTHSGISGPAALQASLYWNKGDPIKVDLLPDMDLKEFFAQKKKEGNRSTVKNLLCDLLPSRFATRLCELDFPSQQPLPQVSEKALEKFCETLHNWVLMPNGTVGYSKAEVTRGGVDTNELSSKSMESKKVPGLYFIGEVVDVTGWLGGYNFQWAWASGWAAGQVV